jgi:hypothetical protein
MHAISPELVLVDPELARRARAELPEPGTNGSIRAARLKATPPAATTRRRPVVGAGAVARRRIETAEVADHARLRKLVLVAAGLIVFAFGIVVPTFFAGGDPVLRQPPPSVAGPTTTAIGQAAASADLPRPAARPSPPKATPGRVPTRLFVWLPDRRARYYHVRFSRGKQTVFEAWPTDARVTVPLRGVFRGRSFSFRSGRYRWVVRPAFGLRSQNRFGPPIVRSVWEIPS